MTEKEKRDKAIEEMAAVVPEEMKYPLDRNMTILFSVSVRKAIAKKFYDADYRKADEVRKETAKEILHELKKLLVEPWKSYELCEDDLRRIAEGFGVEVEG